MYRWVGGFSYYASDNKTWGHLPTVPLTYDSWLLHLLLYRTQCERLKATIVTLDYVLHLYAVNGRVHTGSLPLREFEREVKSVFFSGLPSLKPAATNKFWERRRVAGDISQPFPPSSRVMLLTNGQPGQKTFALPQPVKESISNIVHIITVLVHCKS